MDLNTEPPRPLSSPSRWPCWPVRVPETATALTSCCTGPHVLLTCMHSSRAQSHAKVYKHSTNVVRRVHALQYRKAVSDFEGLPVLLAPFQAGGGRVVQGCAVPAASSHCCWCCYWWWLWWWCCCRCYEEESLQRCRYRSAIISLAAAALASSRGCTAEKTGVSFMHMLEGGGGMSGNWQQRAWPLHGSCAFAGPAARDMLCTLCTLQDHDQATAHFHVTIKDLHHLGGQVQHPKGAALQVGLLQKDREGECSCHAVLQERCSLRCAQWLCCMHVVLHACYDPCML